ncbi:unnamed protein product [Caenorhabditis auriculariae]|uniref:Solute carrier organic anion transporter family member n=1 Tax=Caenorhabditis auriculariae TaxID=2777116 RepID=A0A8S1GX94_9PELO|nr:unnamed protein product [Caenorhabditis auriculariae]
MERIPLPGKKYKVSITHFVVLMIIVIGIQGTYLGYFVGMLTTLERRFGFTSGKSGLLLSFYDIGHTIAILVVGYFGARSHLPRITGIGVLLSAFAMALLALPVVIYGTVDSASEQLLQQKEMYGYEMSCNPDRELSSQGEDCKKEHREHTVVFIILAIGQFLAGVFAAPFNTLAYVYIDTNVKDKRESPFLLGLLTSMYAFGPALGFALSSGLTQVYTTLGTPPLHIGVHDEHWIGAWWMGFLICSLLYFLVSIPFYFFPKTYFHPGTSDPLMDKHRSRALMRENEDMSTKERFLQALRDFPYIVYDLVRNRVFVTMVIAWMFGSYLIGGYQTYLPKYIETQYGRSASMADVYAGTISIGAIAVSTALGGWLLTKYNIAPRSSILCLFGCWTVILMSYIIGMFLGCDQPNMDGLHYFEPYDRWNFYSSEEMLKDCISDCNCNGVFRFDAVNYDGQNFFSPCHAGCRNYNPFTDVWSDCQCALGGSVSKGLIHPTCDIFFAYFAVMFIGLFFGNLFFMVTMMIVLRSVYDDQKVIALSFASCATNLLGFIPAPIIYGSVIDLSCILWNSRCPGDKGNCVLYDNNKLRFDFHITNASFQLFAIISVLVCYFVSKRVTLPEEEQEHEIEMQEIEDQ